MRQERWNAGIGLKPWNTTLTRSLIRVFEIFKIAVKHILSSGKQPERVMARGVLANWSVSKLGVSGTNVGERLSLSLPAISVCSEINLHFQELRRPHGKMIEGRIAAI